jgi:hypothetical protein
MKKISLGNGVSIDIPTLIDTRLLIQAGSGGGKSHRIRWLLEKDTKIRLKDNIKRLMV